jgi:membrane associated rhomboid family serine protease
VSPYITECPYCGNRLRKRAPKLDKLGRVAEKRRRIPPAPSLPRLRRGEIPGIRGESRPYATVALVVVGMAGYLVWRTAQVGLHDVAVEGKPEAHWWRLITAPFVYDNLGFAFVCLGTIAIFGWLLERRHGPLPVLALFAIGGIGGTAATAAAYSYPIALGGSGAALALLVAWAIPDLLALRRREEIDGDLLGAALIAAVVAVMPLVVASPAPSWIQDAVGVLGGLAIGLPLTLTQEY